MTKLDSVERLARKTAKWCVALATTPSISSPEDNLTEAISTALTEMWDLSRREALREAAKLADSMYDKTYWDDPSAGIAAELERLAVEEGTK